MLPLDPNLPGKQGAPTRTVCWPGLAVIAGAFIVAATTSWRKWPDILIDFGTQLYIPWRILNGAVLYRDLFSFAGGPLSQYFNALLFKIFGVSLLTLIITQLLLTGTVVAVVFRGFLRAADAWTATVIGLSIVLVFAFGQYTLNGNYTYIAPYSFEAVHGLFLSILTIVFLSSWIRTRRALPAIAAGLCTGMVLLTKPEIFLALALTIITAFFLALRIHRIADCVKSVILFICAGIIAPLFFLFFFMRFETFRDSLHSTLFAWTPVLNPAVVNTPFYRWCLGLDAWQTHVGYIILSFLGIVLAVILSTLILRWKSRITWIKSRTVVLLLCFSPLLAWAVTFDWRQCGWPLPLLGATTCAFAGWNYYKTADPLKAFPLLWSVFGLALMSKLGFFPRIFHYGFVLAMPVFISSIYLLFWLLPIWLEKRFAIPGREFRIMVGLVLLIGIGNLFAQSQLLYARKTVPVGSGADTIITYDSNQTTDILATLAYADTLIPRKATLAVLPNGPMLNYLTRRVNPTPCLFWDPPCMAMFGQSTMTAAFEKNPPDYIFIVQQDMSEFGVGDFGTSRDFGLGLVQWISGNYKPEKLFGAAPLPEGQFGVRILKRIPENH